jgi:hypothetical protein
LDANIEKSSGMKISMKGTMRWRRQPKNRLHGGLTVAYLARSQRLETTNGIAKIRKGSATELGRRLCGNGKKRTFIYIHHMTPTKAETMAPAAKSTRILHFLKFMLETRSETEVDSPTRRYDRRSSAKFLEKLDL